MNNRILSLAAPLLAMTMLPGCGGPAAAPPEAPLAGARIGGAFAMTDQDGRPVTERSWPGRYRVMYFGYTYCPDVCPVDLQKLMQGVRAFAAADPALARKVQPIFVSVDPDRDTPAVLKQYVAAFGPGLVGLTGTPAQLAAMAKAYAVVYSREKPAAGSGGAYLMNHSRMAMLFGPDGAPIAILPADDSAEAVTAELGKWVT